jgi:PAS domain S-box-containing protein
MRAVSERARVLVIVLIMAISLLLVTGISIEILYRTAFNLETQRLVRSAQNQARLIEAVAGFEEAASADFLTREDAAVLQQVVDAHLEYEGFGETGEFTLARRDGDFIVFELVRARSQSLQPEAVPFDSALAEPMRRALSGQSGTVVGLDYHGVTVLAAHEPVESLGLGVVAKIDLKEVQAPFWRAGLLAIGVSLLVGVAGAFLLVRVSNPILEEIQKRSRRVEEALAALSESEEMYRTTFELAGVGIAHVSLQGRFVEVNQQLCRITGYTAEEIKRLTFEDITHPEDLTTDVEFARQLLAGDIEHYSMDKRYIRKDSSDVWVNLTGSLVLNRDGSPRHFIAVVEDIGARKNSVSVIKKSLAEKEVLLQEIHHRVKNNMQVISSLLSLQAANVEDRRLSVLVQESQSRVRAMALIHEILYDSGDLSSIDLGTYMTRLTANLARMYRSEAGLVKIEVNSEDVMLGIDVMVPCGLAISEIVSNSLKYAFPEGRSGRIEIRASSTADGGVEIVVRDDGVGISPDVDIRSTGTMGMSLVLGLIEKQLGGSIELDRDAGTTFTILIPGDAEAV